MSANDTVAPGLGVPVAEAADQITAGAVGEVAELRLSDERREALRVVLTAFLSSRAVVWAVGIATVLLFGWKPGTVARLDPDHLTSPFSQTIGNLLIAPATRWDSVWYLSIARTGYAHAARTVFFPLYPGLVSFGGSFVGNSFYAVVGIAISCGCSIAALYLLYRLVALEFDERLARNTVWIFSWLPIAMTLSAVYSESLFLLLAVGCFYAARQGRWALAGLAGGLAAATRNGGLLLLVPLLVLYLYGPRQDREPDREAVGFQPRFRPRGDLAWVALVPLGLLAYMVFLGVAVGNPFDPFTHQLHWGRHFIPLAGIPLGMLSAGRALVAGIPGLDPSLAAHVNTIMQLRHLLEFGFLVLSMVLLRLCWKRLPLAYTAFTAISLAMAVSVPANSAPLKSLPRFTLVMFPLWIALALWATERRRVGAVIAVCAPLLVLVTFTFVSWSLPP